MVLSDNIRLSAGLDDASWRQFVRRWALVSLALILVASWFSYGFYQFDEYYQVTELVSFKLGKTPASELAWEYHQQIRPWLQPGFYYVVARGLMAVGIDNPFWLSFSFRLLSGLIGWGAIVSLMLSARALLTAERQRRVAVLLLALLWLIPYLAVRTSSESLSGDFLALGIAALVLGSSGDLNRRKFPAAALAIAGVCFGLAFEFRYQIAFAVAGATLWLWLTTEGAGKSARFWRGGLNVALVLVAVAGPIALGMLVDAWGYGRWTLTPWNYFRVNILEHRADQFGTDPWYGYVYLLSGHPLAPFSVLWMLAAAVTWWRRPRHLVSLTTLPFVLVHCVIAHKEGRFLFPIMLVSTLMFPLAFVPETEQEMAPAWLGWLWRQRWSWGAKALYGINLVALVIGCVTARRPGVELQKFIYENYGTNTHAFLLGNKDPYENVGVNMFFYRPTGFTYDRLGDYNDLRTLLATGPDRFLLITDKISLSGEQAAIMPDAQLVYRSYPSWMERFNYLHWLDRSRTFSMYAIQRPKTAQTARHSSSDVSPQR